jgi:hypothetical protein
MSGTAGALPVSASERPFRAGLAFTPLMAWLVTLLGIALFIFTQLPFAGHVLNLVFPDSDDIMRLLSVRDLLAGQSWFDAHQYRYLPPEGVPMHWSRLADAPLAATIALLTPLLGRFDAEAVSAFLLPPLFFLVYLGVVGRGLYRMIGGSAVAIAVLVAGQASIFSQFLFRVGRIDHHALQIVLVAAAGIYFASGSRSRTAAALSGLMCALSLAIGLETLPFVAAIAILHVLFWVLDPAVGGRLLYFSATFGVAALAAFAAQTAPELWGTPTCDTLSPPWLLLACGGSGLAGLLALAGPRMATAGLRLAAAVAGSVALVALFVFAYPACLSGPYEMVPEPYRSVWLGAILEAQPAWKRLVAGSNGVFGVFGPLAFSAVAAAALAFRGRGPVQRLLVVSAVCLSIGAVLAQFQVRGLYVASAFVPIVAAIAIQRLGDAIHSGRLSGFRAVAGALAATAFLGPTWSAPAFAVRLVVPETPSIYIQAPGCLLKEHLSRLDLLPRGVVLGPIDLGAYTLLYTRHSIIAAGFHRAVEGIIAGITVLQGSETEVKAMALRYAADYLVLCPEWVKARPGAPEPFARALLDGGSVPWLEPVPLEAGSLKIWRVRHER